MNNKIFVITCSEMGWDNVCGVYSAKTEEDVAFAYVDDKNITNSKQALEWMKKHAYIIQQHTLQEVY